MSLIERHEFQTCIIVVCVYLAFGVLYTLSDFKEVFIDVVFELLIGGFIEWVGDLIFFDVNENEPNILYDRKDKMLRAIVPFLFDFGA
jgi:hypothetical protein